MIPILTPAGLEDYQPDPSHRIVSVKRPWTRQPSDITRIDWGNPITKGLSFVANKAFERDHTSNSLLVEAVTNGSTTPVATSQGKGRLFTGAVSLNMDGDAFGNADVTAMFLGDPGPNTTPRFVLNQVGSSGNIWFAANATSTTDGGGFLSGQLCLGLLQTGMDRSAVYIPGIIDGTLSSYLVGKSKTKAIAYKNGNKLAPSTVGTLVGSPSAPTNLLRVGGSEANGSFSLNATLIITLVWKRLLSDTEARAITINPWQIFKPQTVLYPVVPFVDPTDPPQLLVPSADISKGTWRASSGSDLYAMLDESVPDPNDYILAESATSCEIRLAAGLDPSSSNGHKLRYNLLAGEGTLTVTLRQGVSTIAVFGPHTLTGSNQAFEQILSGAQADSITDYSDLRIVCEVA